MGTGPFFKEIGGSGIALTILAFTLIAFLSWSNVIVDMKLIIVCVDLNLRSLIIFLPTVGVTEIKTHLLLSIISWLFFAIFTFLNFLERLLAIDLLRGEINIFVNKIFDLQIPIITDDAILPVPIKPNFIIITISIKTKLQAKKKPPDGGF